MTEIDTGDTVRHKPSGEEWTVAYERDGHIAVLGYPATSASIEDCELISKATEAYRQELLEMMLASGRFADYAKRRLKGQS